MKNVTIVSKSPKEISKTHFELFKDKTTVEVIGILGTTCFGEPYIKNGLLCEVSLFGDLKGMDLENAQLLHDYRQSQFQHETPAESLYAIIVNAPGSIDFEETDETVEMWDVVLKSAQDNIR